MKKIYVFCIILLCLSLSACSNVREGILFSPSIKDRTDAVADIQNIERSTTEITDNTEFTEPQYFEVVATSTTAPKVVTNPKDEPAENIEYYTVKFVDYDGYSTISVQNVAEGKAANEPPMPDRRGELVFKGWNKDFSNVKQSMIVKAIYQKEWVVVRFFDADGTLLKKEEVIYGGTVSPPYVADKGEYFFDGWDKNIDKVYGDVDLYATYYKIPQRSYFTLPNAYSLVSATKTIPEYEYYRKEYDGICTLGGEDYVGNIVHGYFGDTFNIKGMKLSSFEGILALTPKGGSDSNTYAVELFIYVDGVLKYNNSVSVNGVYREFKVDIRNAREVTVKLVPYMNGEIYTKTRRGPDFIGGLINAVFYEN